MASEHTESGTVHDESGPDTGGVAAVVTDESGGEPGERNGSPGWSRLVILGAAMLAVLLVGATVGMLLTQSMSDDDAAATPGADSVEVGFAQDMSVHHLQAVTMANWARDHSTDPAIRQLAFDIGSTQTEQVGRMKGWLMLWNQPEQGLDGYMTWMSDGHAHGGQGMSMQTAPGAAMPGMATNQELSAMRTLSGRDLDVDFLRLMLRHHQGGTAMAQYAQDHSGSPAVQALTRSILVSQGAEVRLMTQLLAERGAQPLPAP